MKNFTFQAYLGCS